MYVHGDIGRTGCTEIVQWNDVTGVTGEIGFDAVIEVFVGTTYVLPKYS